MARDLSSKRQNEKLQRLERDREHEDDEALAALLRTDDGRRVLCRFARDLGWMGRVWDAGSPRQTDYNAGRQSGASDLMEWAERVAPEEFLTAIGEATRRDKLMAEMAKAATQDKEPDDE
jgi:hypothetical protein